MKQYWMVEEDLSLIDLSEVGTVIDMAITKRICMTCKGPNSFGYFPKDKKDTIGLRPSYFEK
jgi:hypothetical protein